MYDLIPKISTEIIYSAVLKIRHEDSKIIIDNLILLSTDSNIDVTYKKNLENIIFSIKSTNKRNLEVFYFKISSIANDIYNRRHKIEKKNID